MRILITMSVILFSALAAQADGSHSLYGDFRYTMGNFISNDDTTTPKVETNIMSATNNASRLGFKGSYTENDWTALYNYQMGANNDAGGAGLSSRFFFAGLKHTAMGTLKYGRMSTPYKMAGVRLDPFYDTVAGAARDLSSVGTTGIAGGLSGTAGSNFGLHSGLNNGFSDNSLHYWSPTMFGVTVNVGTVIAEQTTTNTDIENTADYNFGVRFNEMGIDAGVQMVQSGLGAAIAGSMPNDKALRIHAMYRAEKWSAGVSHESIDENFEDTSLENDSSHLYAAGTFHFMEHSHVAVSYGAVTDTGSKSTDGTGFSVGAFHNILAKTQASLIFSSMEFDDKVTHMVIGLGISHKFGVEFN